MRRLREALAESAVPVAASTSRNVLGRTGSSGPTNQRFDSQPMTSASMGRGPGSEKDQYPDPGQTATVAARISSLKVLALTLLAEVESLENQIPNRATGLDLHSEVRRFEAELIRNALIRTGGRQRRAARLLGMKVTTLNTKIKRYGLGLTINPNIDPDELHATAKNDVQVRRFSALDA